MMNSCLRWVAFCLLLPVSSLAETTLEELIAEGRLRVNVSLDPELEIVPTQQVKMVVEVATDRWFVGGTRIGLLEVDGAIVLRRNAFATNLTRRIRGQTWTTQLWTLTIHPQRGGLIDIPPVAVDVSVAGDQGGSIQGRVFTDSLSFDVAIPDELSEQTSWAALPSLKVQESFSRSLDDLQPGDAVTRTIELVGSDLPALLLPAIEFSTHPGLGFYPSPPELADINNRGTVEGKRLESVTYIVEAEGRYEFPAQEILWWDTRRQSLQRHVLPAHIMQTSAYVPAETAPPALAPTRRTWILDNWQLIAVPVFLGLLLLLWRSRFSSAVVPASGPVQPSLLKLEREFKSCCRRGDHEAAVAVLYKWLDVRGEAHLQGQLRAAVTHLGDKSAVDELAALFSAVYSAAGGKAQPARLIGRLRRHRAHRSAHEELRLN